jgi:tRNA threonylcarbamoyladenosine biosynthesis protein TsaB
MKGRLWLAIDTATDIASVAVGKPPDTKAGVFVQGARRQAAEIIVLIDHTLEQAGVRPNDLDGIVVGDGPGSFTGLRIGWAAAKGLAQQAGLSLVAVPSLMAAAATVARQFGPVPVAACYDALRGQVYGAVYVFHPDAVETRVAPAVMTVAELARVTLPSARPRVVVGDGAMRYRDEVLAWSGGEPIPLESLVPNATTLLSLFRRAGATRQLDDSLGAEPVYGRPAEAQAKWEARHGRPLPDPSRPAG